MLSDMYTCIRSKRWVRRLQNLSKRACNSPVRADTRCIKVFSRSRAASVRLRKLRENAAQGCIEQRIEEGRVVLVGVITIQFVKIIWATSVRGSYTAIAPSQNHDGWHKRTATLWLNCNAVLAAVGRYLVDLYSMTFDEIRTRMDAIFISLSSDFRFSFRCRWLKLKLNSSFSFSF